MTTMNVQNLAPFYGYILNFLSRFVRTQRRMRMSAAVFLRKFFGDSPMREGLKTREGSE